MIGDSVNATIVGDLIAELPRFLKRRRSLAIGRSTKMNIVYEISPVSRRPLITVPARYGDPK